MNKIKILSNIAINCAKTHKIIVNNNVLNNRLIECKTFNNDLNVFNGLILSRFMKSQTIANELANDSKDNNEEPEVLPKGYSKSKKRDPDRDRRVAIAPEVSVRYMNSKAYRETYAHYMVWQLFRRNFRGQFSPARQRRNCVEEGFVKTSNPCAICRDEYLVLHHTNIDLLSQFICPHSGHVFPNSYVCLCSAQYEKLLVAITLAKDYGLITFDIPFREYNYAEYYPHLINNFEPNNS